MVQGLSDTLWQDLLIKFLLIFVTPEETCKGVRIKSEVGVERPLGQAICKNLVNCY